MRYILIFILALFSFSASAQVDTVKVATDTTVKKAPITEIKVWRNGQLYTAEDIEVICVYDNLTTTAKFYYQLHDSSGAVVSDGNVEIGGQNYYEYKTRANHADRAVVMVMRELRLQNRTQLKK